MRKLFLFVFVLSACFNNVWAQDLKLKVAADSVKLGEVFEVSLSLVHNQENVLFFPNDQSNYGKFELVKKEVFPSVFTPDSLVKDSAIYFLRTFELRDSLPLFLTVYRGEDSVSTRSNVAWLYHLDGVINAKGNQVIIDNSYIEIPFLWDEHLLFLFLFIMAGLATYFFVVWFPKYLKKKRVERFISAHEKFKERINYRADYTNEDWSTFFSDWKMDISNSLNKNVSGFTTRKLSSYLNLQELLPVLKKLERILYDPKTQEQLTSSDFDALLRTSDVKFQEKLKKMQDDK